MRDITIQDAVHATAFGGLLALLVVAGPVAFQAASTGGSTSQAETASSIHTASPAVELCWHPPGDWRARTAKATLPLEGAETAR